MKKKFTKKILGVFLVALVAILPFCTTNVEKVSAVEDSSCTEYTNYYFFLHVASMYTTFKQSVDSYKDITYPITLGHTSYFSTKLPEGADVSSASYKWIDLKNGEDGWNIKKYWQVYYDLGPLETEAKVKENGTTWYYGHTKAYFTDTDGTDKEEYINPTQYDMNDVITATYAATASNGAIAFKLPSADATDDKFYAGIRRTVESDWKTVVETAYKQYSNGKHPTDAKLWMPALMQVKYNVCSEKTEQPTTNKVTVKYLDKDTNQELRKDVSLGDFSSGQKYSTDCMDTIGDYKLTSDKSLSGTMKDKDVTLYCYYSKEANNVPTYKVTVNYLDKKTKKSIKDPFTHTTEYKSGDKYTASCPESIGNNYILDSYNGNLTGTIANSNVTVDCLYTSESVKTSDIPIYIVWGVGGSALAYSIYYFRKYYKEQNSI